MGVVMVGNVLIKQFLDVHQMSNCRCELGSWSAEFRGKVQVGEINLGILDI